MTTQKIECGTLQKLLAKITRRPVEKIIETARLRSDIGLDSLAALELAVVLEEDFGIVLSHESMQRLETVGDLNLLVGRGS